MPQIIAKSFIQKTLGLMFKQDFNSEMVFLFEKPTSTIIHTFFMRFDIDVTCFDENGKIIREVKNLKPYRALWVKNISYFVEKKSKP